MSDVPLPRRLHPIIPIVSLVRQLPELLLPTAGMVALSWDKGLGMLLPAVGAMMLVVLAFQVLAWWRFTYTLLPNEMYIESGVFSRNRRSIPWERVQDVEIERGPLARVLGLAKVKLQTGGSGSDEGLLDSIALADATALRDEIRARRGVAIAPAAQEPVAEPPVFRMTLTRILQAGLFNFSLIWLAVIVGAAQYFGQWLPSWEEVGEWIGLHERELWGMVNPATILFALVLFLVVSTLAGVTEMLVRNYGFTLSHERRTLRLVRGLITRSEVAIPLRRIQAARTVDHWIKRRWGLCRVEVQSMGAFGGMEELAPLANANEAERVLTIAGDFKRIAPDRFTPVAPIDRWYDALTKALPLAVLSLLAGLVWPPAWLGLVLAVLWGTAQVISARPHGWRVEADVLQVRDGWFSQDHWLLPLGNIQSVSLSVGPLQRRLKLATVAVDSAGGQSDGLRIRNLAIDDARALVVFLRTQQGGGTQPLRLERTRQAASSATVEQTTPV
ncbi:MAG: PH domain-containing protein [Alphaproteobacteria bacterium]|nr:PH domain-containing protein [Alphaproteobacteria bacterium]